MTFKDVFLLGCIPIMAALVGAISTPIFQEVIKWLIKNWGKELPPPIRTALLIARTWGILGLLAGGGIAVIAIFLYQNAGKHTLFTFDGDVAGWRFIEPGNGRQVATGVQQSSGRDALLGEFNFALADSAKLIGDEEPRATFFIDGISFRDWTRYQRLVINAQSLSTHPVELNVSFTLTDNCWYELGDWVYLTTYPQNYIFDLTRQRYKTCDHILEYDHWPAVFTDVQRLDLIIGTNAPQKDWHKVHGEVQFNDIRLETKKGP